MIDDKDFLKLYDEAYEEKLSREELEEIIDEELQKSEEEMDVDLIEACLKSIEKLDRSNVQKSQEVDSSGSVKHRRFKKYVVGAVAAVMVVISLSAIYFPKIFKENDQPGAYAIPNDNLVEDIHDRYNGKITNAYASSDRENIDSFNELIVKSKFVLKAVAVSAEDKAVGQAVTFKLNKIYKGEAVNSFEVYQLNSDSLFKKGNEYLLFLDEKDGGYYSVAGAVGVMGILGDIITVENKKIADENFENWLKDNMEKEYIISIRN